MQKLAAIILAMIMIFLFVVALSQACDTGPSPDPSPDPPAATPDPDPAPTPDVDASPESAGPGPDRPRAYRGSYDRPGYDVADSLAEHEPDWWLFRVLGISDRDPTKKHWIRYYRPETATIQKED